MNYSLIIRPLIGAAIGYVTNWIAVKMMFRPLTQIRIGKFTLPFTPGIIPKNKSRLAESIGNTISNDLLTDDDLKNVLLSDNIKEKVKESIIIYLNKLTENESKLEDFICNYTDRNTYQEALKNFQDSITHSIHYTVLEANLGNLIAEQIHIVAQEKLKGSMLGIFGGNAIISPITTQVAEKVNEYIENDGQSLILEMVEKETTKYTSKSVGEIITIAANSEIDLVSIIMNIYEKVVTNKISNLLKNINISKMITDKINSMDVLELEKLILLIMKKELNALVNLGAIIGFILGLLNLLF